MDIGELIDAVIDREGGYSDHPADRGGATRFGITQAVARANGYGGDMRALPRETAVAIYRRVYWKSPGYEGIAGLAPRIAGELFDTGVNMGPGVATGFLQRALNALNRGGDGLSRPAGRRPGRAGDAGGARRVPETAGSGGRAGAAEGDRGAPGRALCRAGRASSRQRGVPVRLARKPWLSVARSSATA